MTNNSKVLAYNIAEDYVPKSNNHWYNKPVAFWLITFLLSAGIVAAVEMWLLPVVVNFEFDMNWIKPKALLLFAEGVVAFTQEAAPYSVPIITAILWLRFNFSLRKLSSYGFAEYLTSIGSAVLGMVVAMLLTAFACVALILITIVLGVALSFAILKLVLIFAR